MALADGSERATPILVPRAAPVTAPGEPDASGFSLVLEPPDLAEEEGRVWPAGGAEWAEPVLAEWPRARRETRSVSRSGSTSPAAARAPAVAVAADLRPRRCAIVGAVAGLLACAEAPGLSNEAIGEGWLWKLMVLCRVCLDGVTAPLAFVLPRGCGFWDAFAL
jgi:hypothetical protein